MRWKGLVIVLTMLLWPFYAAALTRDDFLIRTTQDLLTLCTARESDPLYQAAIGFCHGYATGAYQYYEATTTGAEQAAFVCLPNTAADAGRGAPDVRRVGEGASTISERASR